MAQRNDGDGQQLWNGEKWDLKTALATVSGNMRRYNKRLTKTKTTGSNVYMYVVQPFGYNLVRDRGSIIELPTKYCNF